MDKPSYLSTWSLITSLWSDWNPNDATARLCAERWGELHQDHLQEAAKLHKMEASGQYREPKIHRIMEIYASRTTTAWVGSEPAQREWKTDEITPSEEAEWDRWAEDVMSNVTDDELAEAATLVPANSRNRVMACAVDFVRNRRRDPDYARKVLAGVAR